jgi:hypothetical protein
MFVSPTAKAQDFLSGNRFNVALNIEVSHAIKIVKTIKKEKCLSPRRGN